MENLSKLEQLLIDNKIKYTKREKNSCVRYFVGSNVIQQHVDIEEYSVVTPYSGFVFTVPEYKHNKIICNIVLHFNDEFGNLSSLRSVGWINI